MQILYSILVALALCLGFYFGFKLGRTNDLPHIKTRKQIKKSHEEEKKRKKFEKELSNLDGYNGSSEGQEDIV
jgi:uncharacterized protein YxeA